MTINKIISSFPSPSKNDSHVMVEFNYKKLRMEQINFLEFINPKSNFEVYNFKINEYKIQESVCFMIPKYRHMLACIHKKKNKNENDDESSKNLKWAVKKIFPHIMKLNKILCNNKFKIIDLFYNFGEEIFKIIENEEYKRED